MSIGAIDACDNLDRDDILDPIAPGEDNEGRVRAQCGHGHHPPDVPDQRESHEGGEEGADETGWTIPWHLDCRIAGLVTELRLPARALLNGPIGLRAFDVR